MQKSDTEDFQIITTKIMNLNEDFESDTWNLICSNVMKNNGSSDKFSTKTENNEVLHKSLEKINDFRLKTKESKKSI